MVRFIYEKCTFMTIGTVIGLDIVPESKVIYVWVFTLTLFVLRRIVVRIVVSEFYCIVTINRFTPIAPYGVHAI